MLKNFSRKYKDQITFTLISFEQIFSIFVRFFLTLITLRLLPQESYALSAIFLSILSVLSPLGNVALHKINTRELLNTDSSIEFENKARMILNLRLVGSLIAMAIANIVIVLFFQQIPTHILFFSLIIPTAQWESMEAKFIAQDKINKAQKIKIFLEFISFFIKISLIFYFKNMESLLGGLLIENLIYFLSFSFFTQQKYGFSSKDIKYQISLINESKTELLAAMGNMFSKRQVIIIGSFFFNTKIISNLAFSLRIAELIPIFSGAIDTILFPKLNKLFNNSKRKYIKTFSKNLKLNNLIAYCFMLSIIIFYPIIPLIFGEKYANTQILLVLFGGAYMFDGIGSISGTLLTIESKLIHNFWRNFYGLLAGVSLTLLFLQFNLNYKFLALSFLFSQIICYLVYDFFRVDLRNIGVIKLKSLFFR